MLARRVSETFQTTSVQEDSEICRDIRHPLTDGQLRPLARTCRSVTIESPLQEDEHQRLGSFLKDFPDVILTVSRSYGGIENFRFLRFYPSIKHFRALFLWNLRSFEGIENLSAGLESLELDQTKSRRFSLAFLRKFKHLKKLYLEGHTKDFDVVSELKNLEDLTIRSITLPDLEAVADLPKLWSLDIKLGGTTNLAALSRAKSLKYLELWMIKGLADISVISEITTLQFLFLQDLKNVVALPRLKKLKKLRRLVLVNMKGISDVTPVLEAESLEDFVISVAPLLLPEDLTPLKRHPALKTVGFGTGSARKNERVKALFPDKEHHLMHPFIYR